MDRQQEGSDVQNLAKTIISPAHASATKIAYDGKPYPLIKKYIEIEFSLEEVCCPHKARFALVFGV